MSFDTFRNLYPQAFELESVWLAPSENNSQTFVYLPAKPQPETAPNGKPAFQVIASDQGALLQFGAHLGLNAAQEQALRRRLAQRLAANLPPGSPPVAPEKISLRPAPVEVLAVRLLQLTPSANPRQLGSANSSGFPPYTALFRLTVDNEGKNAALAAVNGTAERLGLVYPLKLSGSQSATGQVTGEVGALLKELGREPSLAACQIAVEEALEAGRIQVTIQTSDQVSQALLNGLRNTLLDKAAAVLQSLCEQQPSGFSLSSLPGFAKPAEAELNVEASASEPFQVDLELATDLADWFSGQDSSQFLLISGTTIAPDKPDHTLDNQPTEVSLDFDPANAPLAFVQVQRGQVRQTLSPPNFAPVKLPAASGELVVRTQYRSGGAMYESRPRPTSPQGWALTPGDLGLRRFVIDASMRKAAGAQEIRLEATYNPGESGESDQTSLRLRGDHWSEEWFAVSRKFAQDGTLSVRWRETGADGKETSQTLDNLEGVAILIA